jgi:hypothetical protein
MAGGSELGRNLHLEFVAIGDTIEVDGNLARRTASACLPEEPVEGAEPPEGEEVPEPPTAEMLARLTSGQVWGSVAVTKGGIRKFPEGRYAEIELTTDDRYTAGSLQIAVTSTTPPALEGRKIKSIFMTPNARIIDVYGQIWATGEPEAMFGYPICNLEGNLTCEGWDTFVHPSKTRIGLLLRPDGLLFLFLGDEKHKPQYKASIPTLIFGKNPAYLVVDLQGRCTQVTMQDTRPPRLSADLYDEGNAAA